MIQLLYQVNYIYVLLPLFSVRKFFVNLTNLVKTMTKMTKLRTENTGSNEIQRTFCHSKNEKKSSSK